MEVWELSTLFKEKLFSKCSDYLVFNSNITCCSFMCITLLQFSHSIFSVVALLFCCLGFIIFSSLFFLRDFIFRFFSIWVFFHNHSRITGLQGKGEDISLTPHYHFYLLHRYLDVSRPINAESSPLHIGSSQTRAGNL